MAQVQVTMPKMGESITEGTVIVWHKQPGDAIELDETLLEIGTDKVDTEVPSPAAGTLVEILVEEGDTVEVDTAIAVIETDADAVDLSGDGSSSVQPAAQESEPEVEMQAPEPEHAHGDSEAENLAQAMSGTAVHEAPAESAATGEVQDVVMPKMGESITEGTVIVWHKQPGDAIELDETLLEIGTDKVDTEVPSPAAGTLVEILVEEGDTVEVGSVIARIGVGEGASVPQPAASSPAPSTAPAQSDPPKAPADAPSAPAYAPISGQTGDDQQSGDGSPITRTSDDGRFLAPRSLDRREGRPVDGRTQPRPGQRPRRTRRQGRPDGLPRNEEQQCTAPARTAQRPDTGSVARAPAAVAPVDAGSCARRLQLRRPSRSGRDGPHA